jgi:aminocarboxymuconate-semialdehyde decarboxylase
MKIDVFNHILPTAFLDRFQDYVPAELLDGFKSLATIYDVDARLRMLERFDDYQQILSQAQPVIDEFASPADSPALARLVNDCMADICRQHPDRFVSFIAALPMNNPGAAVMEIDRAVGELDACGVQIFSNVDGRPLDAPEFRPVFARMAELGRPIWLHPARPPSHADYRTEDRSLYDIWWGLGWAYETSVAMARIVFSGILQSFPDLKIICHHWGGYIPHAEGRMEPNWQNGIANSAENGDGPSWQNLDKPLLTYFRKFYGDTALFGGRAAGQCGLDFFGADHSVFATDYPFDPEGGAMNIRRAIALIESLDCTAEDRRRIYQTNPRIMLGR